MSNQCLNVTTFNQSIEHNDIWVPKKKTLCGLWLQDMQANENMKMVAVSTTTNVFHTREHIGVEHVLGGYDYDSRYQTENESEDYCSRCIINAEILVAEFKELGWIHEDYR